ncbi:MAG: pyridoxal phosphate-dependent aminotransferase [Candidatus Thermoplasmatota archaeon]|jgi:aspartate aminotransferase|nr:pyridoxal phosphate-dependent aminotransferase [Candidatus Thermoplasmatota archaeon]MDP7265703.1 pyridoxal phosphate-dependent aminotransferase [Candidatus Thermoplasmatota archaeon]
MSIRRIMNSYRMVTINPSATLAMGEMAKQLSKDGINVTSFSMGEPDFVTPSHIREAAKKALDDGYTYYTPSEGMWELRMAVAEKSAKENDIPCSYRDVIITPAKHGIFSSIFSTVGKGSEVIVPDPLWVSYIPQIDLAEAKPVFVPLKLKNEFRMVPEDINEKITPYTKMIILNSPSNPTGAVLTLDDLKGIADLAIDNDLIVLADEIYEKVIYDAKHYSIASLPDMFERTITINGFSKAYAMTGWRMGWVVAPPPLFKGIAKIQQHTISCATSFAQRGALEALKGPKEPLNEMVSTFRERRDYTVKRLNDIEGIHCLKPKGAFYTFFSFDYDMSSMDLATHLLQKAHVAMTPGSAFGPSGEGFIRMSYANSLENIIEGLYSVEMAVRDLPIRWRKGDTEEHENSREVYKKGKFSREDLKKFPHLRKSSTAVGPVPLEKNHND